MLEKHGNLTLQDLLTNTMAQTLFLTAGVLFVLDIDSGRIDDLQQYEQQYNPEEQSFRNDALSWYEPSANNPFCETGSPELVNLLFPQALRLELQSPLWCPCAALRFIVGEEFSGIPLFSSASACPVLSAESLWVSLQYYFAAGAPAKRLQKYLLSQPFQAIHKMMVMHHPQ